MSFEAHRSPARVSAAAAARLPRWLFWALLLLYGVVGLSGRDPWFQDDAASFGVMWTMARGDASDWWLPNVLGATVAEEGIAFNVEIHVAYVGFGQAEKATARFGRQGLSGGGFQTRYQSVSSSHAPTVCLALVRHLRHNTSRYESPMSRMRRTKPARTSS